MSDGFAVIMRPFQAFTGNPDNATYPETYPYRTGVPRPRSLVRPPLSYKAF